MIDFIPLENYSEIYLNFSLFIVLLTLLHSYLVPIDDRRNLAYIKTTGGIMFVLLSLYLGLRPVSGKYFGDMITYTQHFERYADGIPVTIEKDVAFHYFMKICSSFMTITQFFLLCTLLYMTPMLVLSRVLFKEYWFYGLLVFIVSFQFWPYATNGIRNGIATSFFLLGISFYKKKYIMLAIFLMAYLVHSSVLLPIAAFCMCYVYNKPKFYLYGWLLAIPVSLAIGGILETLVVSMGLGDDRLETYLGGDGPGGGFRFDFLLYSSSAVFTGWYFIFKRKFDDTLYFQIFNTYLITNAFWILVIRANFSNRFAYLSWFMIGLVIIYPFLKQRFYLKQHTVIGWVIFFYFSFTYFMSFVYYKFIK